MRWSARIPRLWAPVLLLVAPTLLLVVPMLLGRALPAWAAEAPQVSLQAEAGFEGRAKAGQWVPVTVTIANAGAELSGSLQFENRLELGPNREQAIYQYPVVVPAGATKRVTLQMPPSMGAVPTIRLVAGDKGLAEIQPRLEITWDVLIGVLGVEPAEVAGLSGLRFGQRTARLVRLTPESLPSEVLALQNLDAILLDRLSWAELSAPQQQAIKTWVEHGGILIAAGGPEVKRLEPLFPWMGLKVTGVDRTALEGIGPADMARIDEDGWSVTRRIGPQAIGAQRTKGVGTIHFLAFDPALEPFASWSGLGDMVRDQISRGADLSAVDMNQAGGPVAMKSGMMLVDLLSQTPLNEIPSTRRLLSILGIYALLVGPVHLLLLRGFKRLGWALITLPLLSVGGAGTAWAYMQVHRGIDVKAVSLALIEGQPGGSALMVRSVTGFYLPPGASHTAELGGALLSPLPSPDIQQLGMPYQPSDGQLSVVEGRRLLLEPKESWQMQVVAAEGIVPAAGTITGDMVVDGFRVTGTVTNNLPYPIEDALIVVGPNFQRLGTLAPGQAAEVSVILPTSRVEMGVYNRIGDAINLAMDTGMNMAAGPTPEQVVRMRRQQAAWALSSLLPWSELPQQPRVMLIGWLNTAGLPLSVDGHAIEPTATALYVQPLAHAFSDGEFSLPADWAETRVVDSSGVNQRMQWGWGLAKGGSATIEHTVPVELLNRITEMDLRIPVIEKGPAQGDLPLTVRLWRWSDATWVEKPFAMNGITLQRGEGFLSPDGRVRVQILKTSDAPLVMGAPGLSIRGKGVGE